MQLEDPVLQRLAYLPDMQAATVAALQAACRRFLGLPAPCVADWTNLFNEEMKPRLEAALLRVVASMVSPTDREQ